MRRDEPPRLAEPMRGHVAVDRLVVARLHEVRLVPDAGAVAPPDSAASTRARRRGADRPWPWRTLRGARTTASTARSSGAPSRTRAVPSPGWATRWSSMCFIPRRPPRSTRLRANCSLLLNRAPIRKTTKSPSISAVIRRPATLLMAHALYSASCRSYARRGRLWGGEREHRVADPRGRLRGGLGPGHVDGHAGDGQGRVDRSGRGLEGAGAGDRWSETKRTRSSVSFSPRATKRPPRRPAPKRAPPV